MAAYLAATVRALSEAERGGQVLAGLDNWIMKGAMGSYGQALRKKRGKKKPLKVINLNCTKVGFRFFVTAGRRDWPRAKTRSVLVRQTNRESKGYVHCCSLGGNWTEVGIWREMDCGAQDGTPSDKQGGGCVVWRLGPARKLQSASPRRADFISLATLSTCVPQFPCLLNPSTSRNASASA